MWFGLLGVLIVLTDDGRQLDVGPPQRQELLALLLSKPNQSVSVDSIVDALWPDAPDPAQYKGSVHSHISRLRSVLGRDRLITRQGGYLIRIAPDTFDVLDFVQSIDDGLKLAANGSRRSAFEELSGGLKLWRGEPYEDFVYSEWSQLEIARLTALRRSAVHQRFRLALSLGMHDVVIPELETETSASPDDEGLTRLLAMALYQSGRQSEALDRLAALRRYLVNEMGLNASPETDQLELAILEHNPSSFPDSLNAPPVSTPVPEEADARLFRERTWEGNIREPLSEFVGRVFSIAELTNAVSSNRLLTITGPGGSGKTRLATRVALGIESQYRDRAWLIDLDKAVSPEDVVPTIRRALGLVEETDQDAYRSLTRAIDGREALLVFDNCEHVIEAAARISEEILQACRNVRIIATSREPLAVPGEQLWRISTLDVPPEGLDTVDQALTYESVELFVKRAKNSDASFRMSPSNIDEIVRICRALDGLPLAIEMAAAQLAYRPLSELATGILESMSSLSSRQRFAPARHRTLAAAIDWSIGDLADSELTMLTRLSVFETDFDRSAALAISHSGFELGELTLHELVDRSLVTPTSGVRSRYRLLVPLRTHMRRQLAPNELEAVKGEIAEHLAERATRASDGLQGEDAMDWYWWCLDSRSVIRTSLRWCLSHAPTLAATMVTGLYWYFPNATPWLQHVVEAANMLSDRRFGSDLDGAVAMLAVQLKDNELATLHARRALGHPDASVDARFAAMNALAWAGLLTQDVDQDLDRHIDWIQQLSGLAHSPFQRALADHLQGLVHVIVGGDPARAIEYMDASVETAKKHDFQWLLGYMMNNRAETLHRIGRFDLARAELDEAAVYSRELQIWPDLAAVLISRAFWHVEAENVADALTASIEAVDAAFRHGVESELAVALEVLTGALLPHDKELASIAHAAAHWIRRQNRSDFDGSIWDLHNRIVKTVGPADVERDDLETAAGVPEILAQLEPVVGESVPTGQ